MSAEMNNKYDVGNFAKLLETFNPDKELENVNSFINGNTKTGVKPYLNEVGNPKFDFVQFETTGPVDFRRLT